MLHYVEQQGDGTVAAARHAVRYFKSCSADPQQYIRAEALTAEDCQAEMAGQLQTLRY